MQLRQFLTVLREGISLKAVMFGDSITAGSQIDPEVDLSIVYHQQWHDRLLAANPGVRLTRINSGIPGDTVSEGLARLQDDVLSHCPDLIVIAFGINDCWLGKKNLPQFSDGLEELATRASERRRNLVVLMTTNMMNTRVDEKVLELAPFAEKSCHAQTNGWTSAYMQEVRNVAERLELPLIDGYEKWEAFVETGRDPDSLLANGANHPNFKGHALLADAMWETLPL